MNDTKTSKMPQGKSRFSDALIRAARNGDDKRIALLMDGCNPRATDKLGDTALMQVLRQSGRASDGSAPTDLLLPITDISVKNVHGEDALILSAKYSAPKIFAAVLSRSDPSAWYSCPDESILHVAADEYAGRHLEQGEQAAKIAMLLADPRVDPNRQNEVGNTALHVACDFGVDACDRVNALLAKVDPSVTNDKGRTALMLAAKRGHADSVKALIQVCDPLAQDKGGMTALMFAAARGDAACVGALAPHSDVNRSDHFGNAAIHLAAANDDHQALAAILRMPGVDVDAVDQEGRSALFHAVAARQEQSVELLLSAPGCNPSHQDLQGQTALHVAAECLHQKIVDTLIDKVDPRVVDRLGRTAADMAASQKPYKASEAQNDILQTLSASARALEERAVIAGATVEMSAQSKPKSRSL